MRVLRLIMKGEYFDQIKAGEKPEEYRLRTPYWSKRLEGRHYDLVELSRGYAARNGTLDNFLTLPFRGYAVKTITHKHFGQQPVSVFAIRLTPYGDNGGSRG